MESEKRYLIQSQLRQFLRAYRSAERLSAEDAASMLGVEITSYRKLEGFKPDNRLVNSVGYLEKIASLREMELPDFTSYLLAHENPRQGKRNLYKWEKQVLAAFERMSISKRNTVLSYLNALSDDEISEFYNLLTALSKKRASKIKLLTQILKEFKDD